MTMLVVDTALAALVVYLSSRCDKIAQERDYWREEQEWTWKSLFVQQEECFRNRLALRAALLTAEMKNETWSPELATTVTWLVAENSVRMMQPSDALQE